MHLDHDPETGGVGNGDQRLALAHAGTLVDPIVIAAPVPAAVMRLLVGPMAEELLLNGQRVVPSALQSAGFDFSFTSVDDALAEIF